MAQNKAVIAIDDLMKEDERITWEWVDTALKKKAPSNWEEYGFGLFFNPQIPSKRVQGDREKTKRQSEKKTQEPHSRKSEIAVSAVQLKTKDYPRRVIIIIV